MRLPVAWTALLACPALFAVNQLAARYVDFVPPHALALGRWACALLILLPFVGSRLWQHRTALRREWVDLLVLGALGMWVCGAFVYIGGRTTSATNIGLIYAASPVVVVGVAALVYGERLWPRQLAGIALCLLGVLWVIIKGDPARLLSVRFAVGDVWIAVASAAWGLYSVLLKYRPSTLDPTTRLAAIIAGGVVVLIPTTALEAALQGAPGLDGRSLLTILVLAVVPGVGAYGAYSFALGVLGAGRAAIGMYLGPLYTGLMAWPLLGETPMHYHIVGALLVLPGIFLATRLPRGR
ncbi:DMT family transporter [Reyranella sp. CPCC 100927]|nr:DMT family transporter [Reyranella sp. CPCC 100927]